MSMSSTQQPTNPMGTPSTPTNTFNPTAIQQQIKGLQSQWASADPNTRNQLHQQVQGLESQLGGTYNPTTGTYSYAQASGSNVTPNNINNVGDWLSAAGKTQQAINSYQSAGRSDLVQGAQNYMNSLNQAAQQKGWNTSQYAAPGGDYSSYYKESGPATAYDPSAPGQTTWAQSAANQQAQQQQQWQQTPQNLMQAYMQMLQGQSAEQQQQMQQMAQQQYNQQVQQYQALQDQYKNALQQQLGQVDNQTAQAQHTLGNQYFQNYLTQRQDMANAGLGGSGIAGDQNTRMLLARDQDLAGIMQDAATQKNSLSQMYNDYMNQVGQQIANTSPATYLAQLQSTANANNVAMANSLAGMFKDAAPYFMPTADNTQNNQSTQMKTLEDWQKWITPSGNNTQTTGLGFTNSLGYLTDASGRPVLGANGQPIPTEKATNDQATQSLGNAKLAFQIQDATIKNNMTAQDIAIKKYQAQNQAANWTNQASSQATKDKLAQLTPVLNELGKEIDGYINQGKQPPADLTRQFNNIVAQMGGAAAQDPGITGDTSGGNSMNGGYGNNPFTGK